MSATAARLAPAARRLAPASDAEAADIVAAARARGDKLRIEGGATRRDPGRPAWDRAILSSAKLAGVTLYEPTELVVSARAGTPLADIEALLDAKGQMLPFEPMDHRALYGTGGAPTIGGVAATNASGPRRILAGAARDCLLGARFVNGAGEIVRSGGRVMKNVTGLDLVKVHCGARGALGLLLETTFKVLPRPEASATLALRGLDDRRAIAALSAGLASPFEPSGAAHLPGRAGEAALTLLRIENFADSVAYRGKALRELLTPFAAAELLEEGQARSLWIDARDARRFAAPDQRAVWRIGTAASRAARLVATIREQLACEVFYDWGGGLVWLACADEGDAGATVIRAALAGQGVASLARGRFDGADPRPAALSALVGRVEASLDPSGVFAGGAG